MFGILPKLDVPPGFVTIYGSDVRTLQIVFILSCHQRQIIPSMQSKLRAITNCLS